MKISSSPIFIKASNLLFISVGLGLINLLLSPDILSSKLAIIVGIITLLFISGLGLLVRFEVKWIKYVLLCLILLSFNSLPLIINDFNHHFLNSIINIIQSALQVYATILLFRTKLTN